MAQTLSARPRCLSARGAPNPALRLQTRSVRPAPRPCVPRASGGSGCCGSGGSGSGEPASQQSQATSGGCGCSGGSASAAARGEQAAAAAADHQLNGLMGSMERGLSRDEILDAWEASAPRQAHPEGAGERFLDVAAILRSSGVGGDEDDEDADLDALVV